jgi:replicative DNA helicase
MTEEDLTLRLLSSLAEIDGGRLRRGALDGEELKSINHASAQLMQRQIFIEECTRLDVTDVLTHARKLQVRQGRLDLVVIDYLQLMEGASGGDDNRVQELGSISRGLKAIARELDVPVIALSQLSRQIERRAGGEPKLSDLRESGALEQDADIVVFLWKRERGQVQIPVPILDVRVAKHRHGPTGDFQLYFEYEYTRFRELTAPAA